MKNEFGLTGPADQESSLRLAEGLLADGNLSLEQLGSGVRKNGTPLQLRIAVKLVESRVAVQAVTKPAKLGIVLAG